MLIDRILRIIILIDWLITFKGAARLEEVVKRIIEIDEQAENYRAKKIKDRGTVADELQAELVRIRAEFEASLSEEKKSIQEETMRRAEEEAGKTIAGREETLRRMQSAYDAGSRAVVEDLFRELIENMKEG